MDKRTKGQVEALISESMIKFEKDYMGRGPMETRTFILKDMVLVRLKGVLTPAEEQLAKNAAGAELIKQTRVRLLENAKPLLQNLVSGIVGSPVISLHTDISTKTGERVIIFVTDSDLEARFAGA